MTKKTLKVKGVNNMEYIINTIVDKDSINQTFKCVTDEYTQHLGSWSVNTREQGIISALISLGWTPTKTKDNS